MEKRPLPLHVPKIKERGKADEIVDHILIFSAWTMNRTFRKHLHEHAGMVRAEKKRAEDKKEK